MSLPGVPDGIAAARSGRAWFVALQSGPPRIAVVQPAARGARVLRTISVPGYVSGLRVTPDGRYLLGAAGRGAVVVDLAGALSGAGQPVRTLAAPAAVVGAGPGAAEVAVSPDSRYAFVTLEAAGRVAVFDLRAAAAGDFRSAGLVGTVAVGAGALGIAASPDGRRLYAVSESARVAGSPDPGALTVIDAARAVSDPAAAVVGRAAAPCAPVRVAVSPSGDAVWVTARDGDALLGFSAAALSGAPAHALLSVTRVGAQPLGVAVAGSSLLVADSNLANASGAGSAVSVLRASHGAAAPTLVGRVPGSRHADAIAVGAGPSAGTALVTDSGARRIQLLRLNRPP